MPRITRSPEVFERALAGVAAAVHRKAQTGSTNDDARALARGGAPDTTVVIADAQTAGRGRRDRTWEAAPGEGLLASWVTRPSLPVGRWSILPLLAGVAVAEAVRARTAVEASLKWPNDVRVGERKLGGILVEAEPPAWAVVGVGLNVSQTLFPPDLGATSLALEGALRLDRADLLAAVMTGFAAALDDAAAALDRYRSLCATLGARIEVARDGAEPLRGVARAIEDSGALLVETDAGEEIVTAGDVLHVRPDQPTI